MQLARKSDEEILAVVEPIMSDLMQASTDRDHARHVRHFSDRLRAIVTPDRFEEICARYQKEWGFLGPRELVGIFRRRSSVAVVWKQWCTDSTDEFVAELVLVEDNDRYLVDHVVFF